MAHPQVAATNTSTRSTSGTSHAVSLPAGINVGDLLLVFFATDGDISFSDLDGFTELFSTDNGKTSSLSVLYKIAGGGDTLTLTTNEGEQSAHISWRITGHSDVNMPEVSAGAVGATANPDPDELTPGGGTKEYLWIAVEGNDDDDMASVFPLPDNQATVESTTGNNTCAVAVCSDELSQASLNPGTFTISSEQWVACTVAVYPAAGSQTYQGVVLDGVKLGDVVTSASIPTAEVLEGIKFGDLATGDLFVGSVSDTVTPSALETEVKLYGDPLTEVILGQKEQLEIGVSVHNPLVVSQPPVEIPPLVIHEIVLRGTPATHVSVDLVQTAQRETQITIYDPTIITPFEGIFKSGFKLGDLVTSVLTFFPRVAEGHEFGDLAVGAIVGAKTTFQGVVLEGIKFGDLVSVTIKFPLDAVDGLKLGDVVLPNISLFPSITEGFKLGELITPLANIITTILEGIKLGDVTNLQYIIHKVIVEGIKTGDVVSPLAGIVASVLEGVKIGEITAVKGTVFPSVVDGIKFGELVFEDIIGKWVGTVTEGIKFGDVISSTFFATVLDGVRIGDITIGVIYGPLLGSIVDGIKFDDDPTPIETGGLFVINGEDVDDTSPWEWDSIELGIGPNLFALDAAARRAGTYGYKAEGQGGANAYGKKIFSAQTEMYVRGYFYVAAGFSGTASQQAFIFRLYDGLDDLISFGIETDGSSNAHRWTYNLGGAGFSSTNFSLGAWHRVDIHWRAGSGADGGGQIWVDGDNIRDNLNLNHSAYAVDILYAGIYAPAFIPDVGAYIYIDDIKVDTSFIGVYAPGIIYPRAQKIQFPVVLDGVKVGDLARRVNRIPTTIIDGVKLGELETVTVTFNPEIVEGLKLGDVPVTIATFMTACLEGIKFKMEYTTFPLIVRMSFDTQQATITFTAVYPVISFKVGR